MLEQDKNILQTHFSVKYLQEIFGKQIKLFFVQIIRIFQKITANLKETNFLLRI